MFSFETKVDAYRRKVKKGKKYVNIQQRAALIAKTVGFETIKRYCREAKAKDAEKSGVGDNFFSMFVNK